MTRALIFEHLWEMGRGKMGQISKNLLWNLYKICFQLQRSSRRSINPETDNAGPIRRNPARRARYSMDNTSPPMTRKRRGSYSSTISSSSSSVSPDSSPSVSFTMNVTVRMFYYRQTVFTYCLIVVSILSP